jgi:hypothetical protein
MEDEMGGAHCMPEEGIQLFTQKMSSKENTWEAKA